MGAAAPSALLPGLSMPGFSLDLHVRVAAAFGVGTGFDAQGR